MMNELTSDDIQDLMVLCEKDFGFTTEAKIETNNYQNVLRWLEKEIQLLLNGDLQKLLNILYRIDIPEEATKQALSLGDPTKMASHLTELIVKRELQKVHTRKKYRSQ